MQSTFEHVIIERKRCCIVVFQPNVMFHIETVIWFVLQIMPGFYMECYPGLKWVKKEYSLHQILSLVCQNVSTEVQPKRTQNSSKNSKSFWRLRLGRGSVERPPSNGEGFRDIHYSMSTVLYPGFHICFIMTLYYKMRQKFITK